MQSEGYSTKQLISTLQKCQGHERQGKTGTVRDYKRARNMVTQHNLGSWDRKKYWKTILEIECLVK